MHWLLILVWFSQGYDAAPLQLVSVPLWVGRSSSTSERQTTFILHSNMGVTYPFHSPPLCLALPTMTQFSEWLHSSLGSVSALASTGIDASSLCLTYVFLLKFAAKSLYLWSSHCPQWMLQ